VRNSTFEPRQQGLTLDSIVVTNIYHRMPSSS
jgi:hypothetical protein